MPIDYESPDFEENTIHEPGVPLSNKGNDVGETIITIAMVNVAVPLFVFLGG